MIGFGIGVTREETYQLNRVDPDFFEKD